MDFRCPTCNKDLTVPDEYAGQLMKCPLCSNVFQAPALPPPPATYGLAPAPTPPAPPPPPPASAPPAPARTEQPKPTKTKEPPSPPPPPPPPGDYSHRRSIWINPRIVPFVAPVAHFLVFVLTFFPWLTFYPDPPTDKSESWMAWGAAFSGNPLLIVAEEIEGEVIDFSDSGTQKDAFAVIKVDRISQPVLVPVDRLRVVPAATS